MSLTSQQDFLSDLLGGLGGQQAAQQRQQAAQQRQQQAMPSSFIPTWDSLAQIQTAQDVFSEHCRSNLPVLSFIDKLRNEIDEWLKL